MDSIITKQAAKVVSVNGNAHVKINGKEIPVAELSELTSGTELILPPGAGALLQLEDGSFIPVGEMESNLASTDEFTVDDEIAALQELLLNEDFDPTQELEATAAGNSSPTNTGAQTSAVESRTGNETVAQAGFDSEATSRSFANARGLSQTFSSTANDLPTLTVSGGGEVNEGSNVTFNVELGNPVNSDITYTLVLNNSATDNSDFALNPDGTLTVEVNGENVVFTLIDGKLTGTLELIGNVTSFNVVIPTFNDSGSPVFEGDESFNLDISASLGSQTLTDSGSATISDDGVVTDEPGEDPTPGGDDDRPEVASVSDTTVSEGEDATFTVTLTNDSTTDTEVSLTLAGDSADKNVDFTGTTVTVNGTEISVAADGSFTVSVAVGDTAFNVVVNTTTDDTYEGDETFTVSAKTDNQTSAVIGTATITDGGQGGTPGGGDDDRPEVASVSDTTVSEGDDATFTVTLTNDSTTDTEVSLTLAGDSADKNVDFTGTTVTVNGTEISVAADGSFTVSVAAGDTAFNVVVNTTTDDTYEGDETFTVSAKTDNQTSAVIGTATITDGGQGGDDDRPTLTVDNAGKVSEGDNASFNVTLSNPVDSDVEYTLTINPRSAEAADLTLNPDGTLTVLVEGTPVILTQHNGKFTGTVSLPGGTTDFSVSVPTFDDNENPVYEGNERFTLTVNADILAPTGNDNVGAATITDNGKNQGDDDRPQLNVSGGGEVSEGDKAYFVVSLTKETENGPVDVKVDGDVTYTLSFGNTDGFTADDISSLSVNGVKLNSDQIKAFFNGGFEATLEGDVSDFKVNVKTHDDNVFEGDEGLTLIVTEGQFTTNGTASANAVFSDDGVIDGNPGGDDDRPTLTVDNAGKVSEGDNASFNVTLSNPVDSDVEYTLTINPRSAEAADLTLNPDGTLTVLVEGTPVILTQHNGKFTGTVSLPGGTTDFSVSVPTFDDNENPVYEGNERFTLTVNADILAPTGNDNVGAATITDNGKNQGDDDRPTLTVDNAGKVSEGDNASFNVTLSNPVDSDVEYTLTINPRSAEAADLTLNPDGTLTVLVEGTPVILTQHNGKFTGTVSLPGGTTDFSVSVPTFDDNENPVYEGNERFTLTVNADILAPTGNDNVGAATITDNGKNQGDDDRPQLNVSGGGEVSEGDKAYFVVSLTKETENGPVDVKVDGDVTYTLSFGNTDGFTADDISSLSVNGVKLNSDQIKAFFNGGFEATLEGDVSDFKVNVKTHDDNVFEGDEGLTLVVTEGQFTTNGTASANAVFSDDGVIDGNPGGDDDRPTLNVKSLGDTDEGNLAAFNVKLGNEVKGKVTYTLKLESNDGFNISDITSINVNGDEITDPNDIASFFNQGHNLTLAGNDTNFSVIIYTKNDSEFEGSESVTLNVETDVALAESGNQLSDTATILDNDNPPVAKDDYDEDNKSLIFKESFEFSGAINGDSIIGGKEGKWIVVNEFNGWEVENGLEIQVGNVGGSTASDGNNHAELDSHVWGNNANSSVTISRELTAKDGVIEGQEYTLTFDFKPRPNAKLDSDMAFTFGDTTYTINVESGTGLEALNVVPAGGIEITYDSVSGWYTVEAKHTSSDDANIELSYTNTGSENNLGAYIDNIEVDGPQPYWVNNDSGNEIIIPLEHILGNDSDLDGDLLSVWLESGLDSLNLVPENAGTISLVTEDGEVTGIKFTPDSEFNGPVQIEYKATDGTNLSNTANIHIYVNEVNANDDGDGILFSTSKADGWENLDGNGFFTVKAFKKGEVLNTDGSLNTAGELITEDSEHLDNKYGMGVADSARGDGAGDVPYQVEYDHETDQSEALRIDLTNPIKALEFGVARLFAEENGTEVGQYSLYDADGNFIKVQEFSLDSGNSGKFTIISDVAFAYVVFEALPRTKDGDNQTSGDASDFVITEITILSDKFIVEEGSTPDNSDADTISGSLFDNDSDPEGHAFSITKVDGNELIFIDGKATVDFDEGTLTIWQNGNFTFEAADQGDDLKAGQKQDFDFTYTIQDEKGDTDSATVHIDIIGKDSNIPEPQAPKIEMTPSNVLIEEDKLVDADAALPTASGTFDISDPDSELVENNVSLSINLPQGQSIETATGETLSWKWVPAENGENAQLVGYYQDATPSDVAVITVELTSPASGTEGQWSYDVTLHEAIKHDDTSVSDEVLDIPVTITVTDGDLTDTADLNIQVKDHGPTLTASELVTTEIVINSVAGLNQVTLGAILYDTDDNKSSASLKEWGQGVGVISGQDNGNGNSNKNEIQYLQNDYKEAIGVSLPQGSTGYSTTITLGKLQDGGKGANKDDEEINFIVVFFDKQGGEVFRGSYSESDLSYNAPGNSNKTGVITIDVPAGFDRFEVIAADNGNAQDNSDFTLVDVSVSTGFPSQTGQLNVDFGADGSATQDALKLVHDGSTSGLTSGGDPISISVVAGAIVGNVNGEPVFRIILDTAATPPTWTLTQLKPIDGDDSTLNFDITATDKDGDTANVTVNATLAGAGDITTPNPEPEPEPEGKVIVSGFGGDDSINANIEAILKTGGLNRDDEAYTKGLFEDAGYVVDSHDEGLLNHDSGKYGNFELELENPYDSSTGAYLFGDLGNDNIIGGAGDDIIRGGANGHGTSGTSANGGQGDTLEGGAGADTFLWMKEDLVNLGAVDGYDHITDFIGDFNVNEDKLDLSDLVSVSNGQLDNLTVGYDDKGQLKISIAVNGLENDTDGNVTQHIVLEKVSQGQEGNEGLDPSAVGGVVLNTIINGKEATLTITDEDGAGTTHNPIVEIKFEEHS